MSFNLAKCTYNTIGLTVLFSCQTKTPVLLINPLTLLNLMNLSSYLDVLSMRESYKTRIDNGLRIWIFYQKLAFSVEKRLFQRQIQEVQNTTFIRHITNISDFVWFQRSCGSMKSVSSFSSIDTTNVINAIFRLLTFLFQITVYQNRRHMESTFHC